MPLKAKSPQRPWMSKPQQYNKMPGQGRYVVTGFYKTKEHLQARQLCFKLNPLCVDCLKEGISRLGNVSDHIKQINPANPYDLQDGKYGDPISQENRQTLCEHHHAVKSAKERWKK
jgi:hypothetical protein